VAPPTGRRLKWLADYNLLAFSEVKTDWKRGEFDCRKADFEA